MDKEFIYDIPENHGIENAIKRAKQFFSQKWKPYWECDKFKSAYIYPLKNGVKNDIEYTGLPYSSVRTEDKFVGFGISMNTFMTAVDNPISVVYTRNISDFYDKDYNCTIKNLYFAYGHVCSSFVSYALDLPVHRSTREIGTAPEFYEILPRRAKSLKLADILITIRPDGTTGGHIRIVTGILRDNSGEVLKVEISEGMKPTPLSKWYTKEEFENTLFGIAEEEKKSKYKIFRYKDTEGIREPIAYDAIKNDALMLNRGDFSNYNLGEEIEFNINSDADKLVIKGKKNITEIDSSMFKDKKYFGETFRVYSVSDLECDSYTAYLVKGEQVSDKVHFIVAKAPDITITDENGKEFKKIKVKFLAPDGSPLAKDSPCLYDENKNLKKEEFLIELYDGRRTIPAYAAVREMNGKLIMRTAANFINSRGERTDTFIIGEDYDFYSYKAEEGDVVSVSFSNYKMLIPKYISWKEENVIAYSQRLITDEEIKSGTLKSVITKHYNHFVSFEIFSENEYGVQGSSAVNFII